MCLIAGLRLLLLLEMRLKMLKRIDLRKHKRND